MKKSINSYPSIYQFGHKAIEDILSGDDVVIQEKVDGSQFSFMLIDGELKCRSKNVMVDINNPGMFGKAVEFLKQNIGKIEDGYVYRCEYLAKEKHNTLKYGRVPKGYLVLFDMTIGVGTEDYAERSIVVHCANKLGIDVVPEYSVEKSELNYEGLKKLLDTESFLGGCKIEGLVIKNYILFTQEKKISIAKIVSEKFQEKHQKDWKNRNPKKSDVIQGIIERYTTEARWRKSVQHLRDNGELEESPRDIGNLIKEIQHDVRKEEEDEIKEILFRHFWKDISRGIIRGFPEWYKELLATGDMN